MERVDPPESEPERPPPAHGSPGFEFDEPVPKPEPVPLEARPPATLPTWLGPASPIPAPIAAPAPAPSPAPPASVPPASAPPAPVPAESVPPAPPGSIVVPVPTAGGVPIKRFTWVKVAWFFYGVVTLFAIGFALFSGHFWVLLGESQPTAAHMLAALGLGCLVVVLCHVAARFWAPFERATEAAARLIGPLRMRDVVVLAITSGIAEELLFRGALWPTLDLAGTSLLFGLVHLVPKRALWLYPLFATAAGLLLGLLRDATESVVPCMAAHAVINGLNLAWLGRLAARLEREAAGLPRA